MGKGKKEEAEVNVTCKFEKESKRFRRYSIGENEDGIVGTVYVPKGTTAPDEITLSFED